MMKKINVIVTETNSEIVRKANSRKHNVDFILTDSSEFNKIIRYKHYIGIDSIILHPSSTVITSIVDLYTIIYESFEASLIDQEIAKIIDNPTDKILIRYNPSRNIYEIFTLFKDLNDPTKNDFYVDILKNIDEVLHFLDYDYKIPKISEISEISEVELSSRIAYKPKYR